MLTPMTVAGPELGTYSCLGNQRVHQYKGEVKVSVSQSYPTLAHASWTVACQAPRPWGFPGKNTGVGCHSLLQGIFLTQGLNPGLLPCRQILYHLSHQYKGQTGKCLAFPGGVSWSLFCRKATPCLQAPIVPDHWPVFLLRLLLVVPCLQPPDEGTLTSSV